MYSLPSRTVPLPTLAIVRRFQRTRAGFCSHTCAASFQQQHFRLSGPVSESRFSKKGYSVFHCAGFTRWTNGTGAGGFWDWRRWRASHRAMRARIRLNSVFIGTPQTASSQGRRSGKRAGGRVETSSQPCHASNRDWQLNGY